MALTAFNDFVLPLISHFFRMQVCTKYMPASKVLIGVDLDKIAPIPGAISLENDITTVSCYNEINNHLSGALVDVYANYFRGFF